jgi:aldose 1-epimerase
LATVNLTNANQVRVQVSDLGGRILSLEVPDRTGRLANVVVNGPPYAGAIVGRYANRILGARFTLDGKTYQLTANEGRNHLHGGAEGFDKRTWRQEAAKGGNEVVLTYVSPDGEEGYPGELVVRVRYLLHDSNELVIEYHATTDKPTHVNLTQHSYFNLAGRGQIFDHLLQINGEPSEFAALRPIGPRPCDQNFVLQGRDAARLVDPASGRTLKVETTEPGLQLYTGDPRGVCLKTQHFPDSPNHPEFPSTILRPGSEYRSRTVFAFGVEG